MIRILERDKSQKIRVGYANIVQPPSHTSMHEISAQSYGIGIMYYARPYTSNCAET